MEEQKLTVKMVLKTGSCIQLNIDDMSLTELASHPKFLKMNDGANDVFVSIEDVVAFEVVNFRKESKTEAPKGLDAESGCTTQA